MPNRMEGLRVSFGRCKGMLFEDVLRYQPWFYPWSINIYKWVKENLEEIERLKEEVWRRPER